MDDMEDMEDMDFELAAKVSRVALNHARLGTPIAVAWPEVVQAGKVALGPDLVSDACAMDIAESLKIVLDEYAALLKRDKPGENINGLWFGLVAFAPKEDLSESVWTPYIAGSDQFDVKNDDWPCDPAWMAEDCYAPNPAMLRLSALCEELEEKAWSIETMLIEPLHTLFTGRAAFDLPRELLLGPASSRGIGCGIDSGDLNTLGAVTTTGFVTLKDLRKKRGKR